MIYKEPTLCEVRDFVVESNHIEGISIKRPSKYGDVWHEKITKNDQDIQVGILNEFVRLKEVTLSDIENFVNQNQPDHMFKPKLRTTVGMDVRVGGYVAPAGGPDIQQHLEDILAIAKAKAEHPYEVHQRYESLHPFQDGNGRSGRALWAWMMCHTGRRGFWRIGFLHTWYYQSLEFSQNREL